MEEFLAETAIIRENLAKQRKKDGKERSKRRKAEKEIEKESNPRSKQRKRSKMTKVPDDMEEDSQITIDEVTEIATEPTPKSKPRAKGKGKGKAKAKTKTKSGKGKVQRKAKGNTQKSRKAKAQTSAKMLMLQYGECYGLDPTSKSTQDKVYLYNLLRDYKIGVDAPKLCQRIAKVQALTWTKKKFRLHIMLDTKEQIELFHAILHLCTAPLTDQEIGKENMDESRESPETLPVPPWHQDKDKTASPNSPILHYANMISGDWGLAMQSLEDGEEDQTYLALLQERKEWNDYLGRAQTDVPKQREKLEKLRLLAPEGQTQFLMELAPIGLFSSKTGDDAGYTRITGFETGLSVKHINRVNLKYSFSPLDSIYRLLGYILKLHEKGDTFFFALRKKYQQGNFKPFLEWFYSPNAEKELLSSEWPNPMRTAPLQLVKPEDKDEDFFQNNSFSIGETSKEQAWKPDRDLGFDKSMQSTLVYLKHLFGSKSKLGEPGTFGFAARWPRGWPEFFAYANPIMESNDEKQKEQLVEEIASLPKLRLISKAEASTLAPEEVEVRHDRFFHKVDKIGFARARELLERLYSVNF